MVGLAVEQRINFADKFKRNKSLSFSELSICKNVCKIENCMKCYCMFDNVTETYMKVMYRDCEHRIWDVQHVFSFDEPHPTLQIKEKEVPVEQPSFVYFIGDGSKVKIGKSNNPEQRLQALQTSHSKKLSILKLIKCKNERSAFTIEKRYHNKYSKLRLKGEWFDILDLQGSW